MRIMLALAWLASANLQNAAHLLPEPGKFVAMCGSDHLLFVPLGPGEKRREHGCEGACHAPCRRQGELTAPGDCC